MNRPAVPAFADKTAAHNVRTAEDGWNTGAPARAAETATVASLARLAALVGSPARAGMLMALMGGRALTATELAHVAGISPQTASGHLGQLSNGSLLCIKKHGRHRYHRLCSHGAQMLKELMHVAIVSDRRRNPCK